MKEELYWGMEFCNSRMFKTFGKIQLYKKQKEVEKIFLKEKKEEHIDYYMTEYGQIFKFDKEHFESYELDLYKMIWFQNRDFLTIYFDNYLKYTEIPEFEDYYDLKN